MVGGTMWEVVEPCYLARRQHLVRPKTASAKQFFAGCVSRDFLEASWGTMLRILLILDALWDALEHQFWVQMTICFQGLVFDPSSTTEE